MKGRKNSDQIGEATCPEHIREEPRERKKKPETERQKNLDRSAWVAAHRAAWPGSRMARGAAWVLLSLFLGFFFFFFFSLWVLLGSSLSFIRFINRVLETRFSCAHVEKYAMSEMIRP